MQREKVVMEGQQKKMKKRRLTDRFREQLRERKEGGLVEGGGKKRKEEDLQNEITFLSFFSFFLSFVLFTRTQASTLGRSRDGMDGWTDGGDLGASSSKKKKRKTNTSNANANEGSGCKNFPVGKKKKYYLARRKSPGTSLFLGEGGDGDIGRCIPNTLDR